MIYFIPQTKAYVNCREQFTIPTIRQVQVLDPETGEPTGQNQEVESATTYPRNTLDRVAADIGAIPQPVAGENQVVEQGADGWVVRDMTQEELDARALAESNAADARVAHAVDRLWHEAWDVWGEAQLAAVDRQTIFGWAGAGVLDAEGLQMARDIITWHDQVFLNHYAPAKQLIVDAGDWVEPDWSTWPACPHTFYDVYARRT